MILHSLLDLQPVHRCAQQSSAASEHEQCLFKTISNVDDVVVGEEEIQMLFPLLTTFSPIISLYIFAEFK